MSKAGIFYPGNRNALYYELKNLIWKNQSQYPVKSRAIISPHAALFYSGNVASSAYSVLETENINTVFVFAPAHKVCFKNFAICDFDCFETPFGRIETDKDKLIKLKTEFNFEFNNPAFEDEHSIEVQLPFLQVVLKKEFKIVPILYSQCDYKKISQILDEFYFDKKNAFVISTDLSHFYSDKEAKELDKNTFEYINSQQIENFKSKQACGLSGILGLLNFAKRNDFSLIPLLYENSSEANADKKSVVGYGSWFLYEKDKNNFIKTYLKDTVLEIARKAIESKFLPFKHAFFPNFSKIPKVLETNGASFVTIELEGKLRGCIGSIFSNQSLANDIRMNAQSAAFKDPRFQPLNFKQSNEIKIEISLMSLLNRISYEDEPDLLNQLEPFENGLFIKSQNHQAVYLPQVWKNFGENRNDFLNSLKKKANINFALLPENCEAYSFTVEKI